MIQNFRFVPLRLLRINLGCFYFQERWNIHWLLRKKTIQDINLSLWFCDLLWDHEIRFKTVSLVPKPWDLAGLLKYEITFTEKHTLKKQAALVCTDLVNASVKQWYELIHFTWKSKQLLNEFAMNNIRIVKVATFLKRKISISFSGYYSIISAIHVAVDYWELK